MILDKLVRTNTVEWNYSSTMKRTRVLFVFVKYTVTMDTGWVSMVIVHLTMDTGWVAQAMRNKLELMM